MDTNIYEVLLIAAYQTFDTPSRLLLPTFILQPTIGLIGNLGSLMTEIHKEKGLSVMWKPRQNINCNSELDS